MPMPYTLTRGPLFTLLENTLNPTTPQEVAVRDDALLALRGGSAITAIPWVTSPDVAAIALPQNDPLTTRIERDWFGKQKNGQNWDPQDAFTGQTTGYWVGYYGDIEPVLREGIMRAIEVSLGITRDDHPSQATRQWPVEVNWKCPNPYFEVWVTWRRHRQEPEEGHVTMMIATPPDKSNRLVTEPRTPPPPKPPRQPRPTPLQPPAAATDSQGMWLVTREHHVQHTVDQEVAVAAVDIIGGLVDTVGSLLGLPDQHWIVPMPSTFWEDTGDVVVVAPPDYAGGADPDRSNAP
jgi:hypothetical protein